jgi:hypothetical protein
MLPWKTTAYSAADGPDNSTAIEKSPTAAAVRKISCCRASALLLLITSSLGKIEAAGESTRRVTSSCADGNPVSDSCRGFACVVPMYRDESEVWTTRSLQQAVLIPCLVRCTSAVGIPAPPGVTAVQNTLYAVAGVRPCTDTARCSDGSKETPEEALEISLDVTTLDDRLGKAAQNTIAALLPDSRTLRVTEVLESATTAKVTFVALSVVGLAVGNPVGSFVG